MVYFASLQQLVCLCYFIFRTITWMKWCIMLYEKHFMNHDTERKWSSRIEYLHWLGDMVRYGCIWKRYRALFLGMNLTLNFGGQWIIPRLASSCLGISSPSTGMIWNFWSILINIKNSSCLAKLSPKHTRLPEIELNCPFIM